jgi:hypothetical protein
MFDPDGVVQRVGLGSSHSTVPEMIRGLAAILQPDGGYEAASLAALKFMEKLYSEETVLRPYIAALTGVRPQ